MSIKLKESQLLAAHLIASGVKSSEILNQLNIRPETLCCWKQEPEFIKVVNDTTEIILNEISQEFKILIGYLLIVIAVSPWIGGLALRLKYR